MTSAIPEQVRLTERALRKHDKEIRGPRAHRPESATTIIDTEFCDMDEVILGSERRQEIRAQFLRDPKSFGVTTPFKDPMDDPTFFVDTRPICARTCYPPDFLRKKNIHVAASPSSQNAPPTIEAAVEESALLSVKSDYVPSRLIQTGSAENLLQNVFPVHFPQFRHIQNHEELGFLKDRCQYAISVGSGPLHDLKYGIIIVPVGEEHMLFRSEHETEAILPATQNQPSLIPVDQIPPNPVKSASPIATIQHQPSLISIDQIQPETIKSASPIATTQHQPSMRSFDQRKPRTSESASPIAAPGLAPISKTRKPQKATRSGRDKASCVTKVTSKHRPQPPNPIRRSNRLHADKRTT